MTISGISSSSFTVSQISQASAASRAGAACESDAVQGGRPPGPPPGGGIAEAIIQALADLGIDDQSQASTEADSSSASADTESLVAAFDAFMHNLLDALHSQGDEAAASEDSSASSAAAAGVEGVPGQERRHHGGPPTIQADLQSLMQQLSASDTGDSDSDATQSSLTQSFQNLLSALGAHDSEVDVGSFLRAFQNNLQSVSAAGNIVNTKV